MQLAFDSRFVLHGRVPAFSPAQVKAEPMFFAAGNDFARRHGGPLTHAVLDALPGDWRASRLVIDSRTHLLMPGWYPCIPGWHLDDVPRTRSDGQPEHRQPAYRAEHILCVVGDAALPLFAVGHLELEDVPEGQVEPSPLCAETALYQKWHHDIERLLAAGRLRQEMIPERALVQFGWGAFHRGTAATKHGWRFFIRVSRNTARLVHDELRRQVQVYLPAVV
jgi:hypothetical protein